MRRSLTLACCIATVIAGCGSDDSDTSETSAGSPTTSAQSTDPAQVPGPEVRIPNGEPPDKLVIKDLKKGIGKPAKSGDTVTVNYVGINWEHGNYANSWTYSEPPTFVLGTGRLPRGFEKGILGMKARGERQVIVPFNELNRPGFEQVTENPGNTVVFLVSMLKVR